MTHTLRLGIIVLVILMVANRRGVYCKTYNEVKYDFRYSVNEPKYGVVMDQWEDRHGEFVKGGYSMMDADGKIRTVNYEVDGRKGFRAVVKRKYPGSQSQYVEHLRQVPWKYRAPYQHVRPVNIISQDLFSPHVKPYPNLPHH